MVWLVCRHGDAMIDLEELCRKAMEDDTLDDLDAAAYAMGFLEPNYPMPAIPLIVSIDLDEVTIWGDPDDSIPGLIEWRKALVTFSIYGDVFRY